MIPAVAAAAAGKSLLPRTGRQLAWSVVGLGVAAFGTWWLVKSATGQAFDAVSDAVTGAGEETSIGLAPTPDDVAGTPPSAVDWGELAVKVTSPKSGSTVDVPPLQTVIPVSLKLQNRNPYPVTADLELVVSAAGGIGIDTFVERFPGLTLPPDGKLVALTRNVNADLNLYNEKYLSVTGSFGLFTFGGPNFKVT